MSAFSEIYTLRRVAKKTPNFFAPTQWSHDKNGVKMHKTWWRATINLDRGNVMLLFGAKSGVTILWNFKDNTTITDKNQIFSHPAITWTKFTGPSDIKKDAQGNITVFQNGSATKHTPVKVPCCAGEDWRQLGDPFCKYIKNEKYYITPIVYNYVIGSHVWYWDYEPWAALSLVPTFAIDTWHSPVLCYVPIF